MSEIDLWRAMKEIQKELDQIRALSRGYYAKSTYTPTYTGATTAGVTTYSVQDGAWTKHGNMIYVRGTVVWTAATGTGNAQISLPVAASERGTGACRLNGVTFANSAPELDIASGAAVFTMQSPLTNAAPTAVAVEAAGNVIFFAAYRWV